jgi:hypothetical protein
MATKLSTIPLYRLLNPESVKRVNPGNHLTNRNPLFGLIPYIQTV